MYTLRHMSGFDRDTRTGVVLFASLVVTFAFFFGGSGFNQNAHLAQARAIVEERTIAIDHYLGSTADLSHHGARTYPNKPPGLSFLTALPYAALYASAGTPGTVFELTLYLYLCTVIVCGASGAGIALLLFHSSRTLGASRRRALTVALVAAVGTPLFAYSTMLFLHVPSAFLLLFGVAGAAGLVRLPDAVAGAALGLATCVNYLSIFGVLAGLLLILARREERGPSLLRYAAGGVPFALLLALYQWFAFGSPFRSSIALENPAFLTPGAFMGIVSGPRLDALWGLTFSPYRGLFYMSPVLLLTVFGAIAAMRRYETRVLLVTIVLTFAGFMLFNISFNGWHGGYAIGPRYILPAIPLLALLLAIGRIPRALFAVLGVLSIALNFAVTAVDPQPPDQLKDPLGSYILPALATGRALQSDTAPVWIRDFYTGHTSTNRVAADEMLPFKRHVPGSPESEWASFNLGEIVFGAGALASLAPLLAFWAAAGALLMRMTRDDANATG